jgi:hypothetical protein
MTTERIYNIVVNNYKCVVTTLLNTNQDLSIEIENKMSKNIYVYTADFDHIKQLTQRKTIMTSEEFYEVLSMSLVGEKNYSYVCVIEPKQMIFTIEMLIPLNDKKYIRHEFEIVLHMVEQSAHTKLIKISEDIESNRQKLENIERRISASEITFFDEVKKGREVIKETQELVSDLVKEHQNIKSNIVNMQVLTLDDFDTRRNSTIHFQITKKVSKSRLLIEANLVVSDVDCAFDHIWEIGESQYFNQFSAQPHAMFGNITAICCIDDQIFTGPKVLRLIFMTNSHELVPSDQKCSIGFSTIKITEYMV